MTINLQYSIFTFALPEKVNGRSDPLSLVVTLTRIFVLMPCSLSLPLISPVKYSIKYLFLVVAIIAACYIAYLSAALPLFDNL